jgi:4-amino-4-deoxy-L-arabinose transferase-like glycosyltransferase
VFKKLAKHFTYQNIILFVLFLCFFLLLRWNHLTAPFERDEGVYAYSAWVMRQGLNPYQYSFPYKPPMIIYTYLLGQFVFGDVIWGPRLLAALASLVTIFLTGLVVKKEVGSKAAWIAMWLLSLFLILPVNFGRGPLADVYYAANTEIFMLVPLIGALYLMVSKKGKADYKTWFLSGILAVIAIAYKPICVFVIAYIYIYWIYITLRSKKDIKGLVYRVSAALLGGVSSSLLIFLPFFVSDGGVAVWTQLVGFTSCYKQMGNWNYGLGQFIRRIFVMGRYYWPLYLLITYFLIKRPKNWSFYAGLLLVAYLSVYQSIIGHYYLLLMPFMAIIGTYSILLISKEKMFSKISFLVIAAFIITTIFWPIKEMIGKTPIELGVWIYGTYDPFVEAKLIGDEVKEITAPNDFIYVEGMDPEILYFSQRKHSVKMEWTNFMSSECKMLKDYKKEYVKDLKKNPPEVVVICVTGSCGYLWEDPEAQYFMDDLKTMLETNYVPVGGWVPKGGKGYWVEPINGMQLSEFRTVVYKKK